MIYYMIFCFEPNDICNTVIDLYINVLKTNIIKKIRVVAIAQATTYRSILCALIIDI